MYELPKYTIITDRRIYDDHYSNEDDWSEKLLEEQEAKCKTLGIDTNFWADEVVVHFFDSPFFDERTQWATVYDALNMLAIKDGVDMVQFANSNYGFIAYYNGNANGFEIIG